MTNLSPYSGCSRSDNGLDGDIVFYPALQYIGTYVDDSKVSGAWGDSFTTSNGELLEIETYLTTEQYNKMKLSTPIRINNNIYRVLTIDGWDATGKNPAKLTLWRQYLPITV